MPSRRKRPCPEGSNCKYQHHYQHTLEFSHGEESDQLALKKKNHEQEKWKNTAGTKLGGSSKSREPLYGAKLGAEAASKRAEGFISQQKVARTLKTAGHCKPCEREPVSSSKRKKRRTDEKEFSGLRLYTGEENTNATTVTWNCQSCTFLNQESFSRCSMCHSVRSSANRTSSVKKLSKKASGFQQVIDLSGESDS